MMKVIALDFLVSRTTEKMQGYVRFWGKYRSQRIINQIFGKSFLQRNQDAKYHFYGKALCFFWLGSSLVLMNHEVVKMWNTRGNKRKMFQTDAMQTCRYSPQCTSCVLCICKLLTRIISKAHLAVMLHMCSAQVQDFFRDCVFYQTDS